MTHTEEAEGGHRIRRVIAQVVRDGGAGQEAAVFTPEALETIREEIRTWMGKPELVDCVEDVLTIVAHLEEDEKSPKAAQALYVLVENDEVVASLKNLVRQQDSERAEKVADAADKLNEFTGKESNRKAPMADEAAPKGSMKLGNLDFPKKL
jgi:hypothetical protein